MRHLEAVGVVWRHRCQERPPRHEYVLTEAGRDLLGALTSPRSWGDRRLAEEPPMAVPGSCCPSPRSRRSSARAPRS
ncbi:winged helix-turn-helix transcriptional regulator [Streptomyces albiaxialis]|uniref:winged helix-turn-helix transcriptional regulator n=1 Tax=Streptomyces albiaxialis TaxID=329523 RepID=UPI0031DB3D7A